MPEAAPRTYGEIMQDIATVLPTRDARQSRWRELYREHLEHIDPSLLEAAAVWCIRHCIHFPRIAELRAACKREIQRRESIPTKERAWHDVYQHVTNFTHRLQRSFDQHSRPAFTHPIAEQTWEAIDGDHFLALGDDTAISYKKARWDEVYATILDEYLEQQLDQPDRAPSLHPIPASTMNTGD